MHGNLDATKYILSKYSELSQLISSIQDKLDEEKIYWNASDNCGSTPVMDAVRFGFIQILQVLLNQNEKPELLLNRLNKAGQNCLHVAAEAGQCEIIRFIVQKNYVDVNSTSEQFGMTALHWATKV